MKIDIQQHDLVPKHEVISESEKEVLQQNSDFDINNLPNVSAGDVLRITRNSKTAGEFISYRIVIEG